MTAAPEFSERMQPMLDAFMAGESESAAAILAVDPQGPFVHHDGRGSVAMLDLLLRPRLGRDGLVGRASPVLQSAGAVFLV